MPHLNAIQTTTSTAGEIAATTAVVEAAATGTFDTALIIGVIRVLWWVGEKIVEKRRLKKQAKKGEE
jgi:p-aminobenzoyl-glutamate transporter AbgT